MRDLGREGREQESERKEEVKHIIYRDRKTEREKKAGLREGREREGKWKEGSS